MNKIKLAKDSYGWTITFPTGFKQSFMFYGNAIWELNKYIIAAKRLEKALYKIYWINLSKLTTKEVGVINSIKANMKCSKKQYGWISGILERQNGKI